MALTCVEIRGKIGAVDDARTKGVLESLLDKMVQMGADEVSEDGSGSYDLSKVAKRSDMNKPGSLS